MYGKKRKFKMTRLKKPCKKGDKTITVETTNVDLVKGDKIGIASTSYKHDGGEDNYVEAYDAKTGVITLKTALNIYHWGADKSTAADYNGIDMRGEVVSLSRNIKIVGENVDSFGCQVLTSDIMEFDGTIRAGSTKMDSVEFDFCS